MVTLTFWNSWIKLIRLNVNETLTCDTCLMLPLCDTSGSPLCSKRVLHGSYSKCFPGEITGSCGTKLFHVLFSHHWLSSLNYLTRWLRLIHFLYTDYKLLPCTSSSDFFWGCVCMFWFGFWCFFLFAFFFLANKNPNNKSNKHSHLTWEWGSEIPWQGLGTVAAVYFQKLPLIIILVLLLYLAAFLLSVIPAFFFFP